jgi:predicted O-methyltransferase YrrM
MKSGYVPSPALVDHANRAVDMADHLVHLHDLAMEAHSIVEFGIRSGVSTWALLDGLPADGTYLGIDIATHIYTQSPTHLFRDPRATFVIGDDREVALPEHADLVMIDSSHEYEHTKQELDIAVRMTPAMIVMHDYLYWSPEPTHSDYWCQVHQAVEDWEPTGSYRKDRLYFSKWGILVLVPK